MKAATGIGIVAATVALLMSATMEGTSPASFINISALIIIVGGTSGVTLASCGMESIPALWKIVLNAEPPDYGSRVTLLVGLAEQARREGLLALDAKLSEID